MGYNIHIERDTPITLAEWKDVVCTTAGVRLSAAGAFATNPRTGEVIAIPGADGDAEFNLAGSWIPCFRWQSGSISFRANRGFSDPQDVLRCTARILAEKLNARMIGDEGERYD